MPLLQEIITILAQAGYKLLIIAIILAVGWAIGRGVGFAVRKISQRLGADSVFRKTAVGRAIIKSGYTASTFSESIAKWIVYIAAVLIALESIGLVIVSSAVATFLDFLPTLAGAIVILMVGLVLSDWFGEFVKREIPQEQRQTLYLNTAAELLKIVLYFLTITIVLKEIGVDVTILYIVTQALAWGIAISVGVIVGIVVGWALKVRIKNILS